MKPDTDLSASFLNQILPAVERHARINSRSIKCQQTRDDFIQEAIALAWKWSVRLNERGINPTDVRSSLATFASRAVASGRRLCRQEAAKDALSTVAQRRHGFTVSTLPVVSTFESNPLSDALVDSTQSSPPEAAAFRMEFPEWLDDQSERDRAIVVDLAEGEETGNVASKYGLSPARISQLRREFQDSWDLFQAA